MVHTAMEVVNECLFLSHINKTHIHNLALHLMFYLLKKYKT